MRPLLRRITKNPAKKMGVLFIAAMLVVTYLPILLIVLFSFSSSKSMSLQSFNFNLSSFKAMVDDAKVMEALTNSVLVGVLASLIATIIGTFTAIGLFNMKRRLRSAIEYSGQITMFNADIVTALAMLIFFMFVGINNDWVRLILSHSIICLPYVIMSIMPRLIQLDPNVYEAGLDLGASPARTLFTVILPQLAGGMVAGFALAFTISMDDFTLSMFVSDINTIPKLLYSGLRQSGITGAIRALSTTLLVGIMAVLVLINVFAARRKKKLAAKNR